MDQTNLLKTVENLVWASCPDWDWNVECDMSVCDCCQKNMIVVRVDVGRPMPMQQGYSVEQLDRLLRKGKLAAFCRRQMKLLAKHLKEH